MFEQWEPEPPESATEAEYSAWEGRNPTWRLAEELEFHVDPCFVELVGSLEAVITQICNPSERALVSSNAEEFTRSGRIPCGATDVQPTLKLNL